MKIISSIPPFTMRCLFIMLASSPFHAAESRHSDALHPIRLTQAELGGEIARRIGLAIHKHFMAFNPDKEFVQPFQQRREAGKWHYAGAGKLIDSGVSFAAFSGDKGVMERTQSLIDAIIATRDADGYIGFFARRPDESQNFVNWTLHEHEYLLIGLIHHHVFNQNAAAIEHARKLADYVMRTFPKNPHPDQVCTAGLPEAFLELYEVTGDKRYLVFAAETKHGYQKSEIACASLRTWSQDYTHANRAISHVYVNMARCFALTRLYRHEPNERTLMMPRRMLREMLSLDPGKDEMLIIGSGSHDEHLGGKQAGDNRACETCVTAYWIRMLDSLACLDGDLRYGDIVERAVYNALFAAQEPAGRKVRYFTPTTGPRTYFDRDGYCCPGNFRRIMGYLPQLVYYRTADGGVAVNLYTASKVAILLSGNRRVTIEQKTDYPSSGTVQLRVSPETASEFPLRLRIPRWCTGAKLRINDGPSEDADRQSTTGHEIRRTWKPGDTVTLDLPMPWRLVAGRQTKAGLAALMRGPIVYCLGTQHNAGRTINPAKPPLIDPGSLGTPVADPTVRPDGLKVVARAWQGSVDPKSASATESIVLSEFPDPSGVATYFRIPEPSLAVPDELSGECFAAPPLKRVESKGVTFASDLKWSRATAGAESVLVDRNYKQQPLRLGDQTIPKGIWTHACKDATPADIVFDLHGRNLVRFRAVVGLDALAGGNGSVQFQVLVDGQIKAETPVLRGESTQALDVELTGAKEITLRVLNGGDGFASDQAVWGLARFLEPGATDVVP